MSTQADFAATLVDEWVRSGVRDAVLCPGSRSAPLAAALLAREDLRVHVRLDERSAAFFAIGCALGSGRPAVVVTTSGTAAAELHAAVLEADLAGIPLVVCTADRPPELHGVGAPQTVDQQGLFGRAVRLYAEPGVADEASRGSWRSLASRLVAAAASGPAGPGPVHANLAFRDPLTGDTGELPAPRRLVSGSAPRGGRPVGADAPWHSVVNSSAAGSEVVHALEALVAGVDRGVVVAGAGAAGSGRSGREGVLELARILGWPVLADPRAWPRVPAPDVVSAADGVLRSSVASEHLAPDVVLHLGAPHASKVLTSWCAETARRGAVHVLVDPFGRFQDPDRITSVVLEADPGELCTSVAASLGVRTAADRGGWIASWRVAESAAQSAIDGVLARGSACSEPGVARELFDLLPAGATLVVASSMPIRDVEWYSRPRTGAARVLANRGANGIDGVTSTVFGVAAGTAAAAGGSGGEPGSDTVPVVGLLGDLAFLHDLSGLVWGSAESRPDATLVVVDNGGGGIFDFLPHASSLDERRFERGFRTPQTSDIAGVARALGCNVREIADKAQLAGALADSIAEPGTSVVLVSTGSEGNVALHDEIHAAVVAAVDGALRPRTRAVRSSRTPRVR
ncbi:MAG: 2-succinyl-5-enolpyruvyl-6-hydroxy-3-cyclohexene-1-carboxylic-acid synthase [Acidimicrobiales bacterium]